MTNVKAMRLIDNQLSHVWMVRTFLKHSEEAEEDDDIREVHRTLYDFLLSLGAPLKANDADAYLKQCHKKLNKLRKATELFLDVQPEISGHMNFVMAAQSLKVAVQAVEEILTGMKA